jgi:hypothetical protein
VLKKQIFVKQAFSKFADEIGLNRENALLIHTDGQELPCTFEISPTEFLDMAEAAFERGQLSWVDVISNAQRAIRSQIDYAIASLGYATQNLKIRSKVELLRDLGVVTPRILNRVSHSRNLLEHQYRTPSEQQVNDALDIATLFVEAVGRTLSEFWYGFVMGREDQCSDQLADWFRNCISFRYDISEKSYSVHFVQNRATLASYSISSNDEFTGHLHRLALAIRNERKLERALNEFFHALGK